MSEENPNEQGGLSSSISVAKPQAKKSEALWMATFSDLSFILMSFFALLLSMSTMDPKKYETISEGFEVNAKIQQSRSLSKILDMIKKEIKARKLENHIEARLDIDGLAVEFKSHQLFTPGSAKLRPGFDKVAGQIISIMAKAPRKYHLSIEGHTDDRGKELANWNLSTRRAIAMLYKFKEHGVRMKQMQVSGFAGSNPKVAIQGLNGMELKKAREANRRVLVRLK